MMALQPQPRAGTVHYANTIIVGRSIQKLLSLSRRVIFDLDTEKAIYDRCFLGSGSRGRCYVGRAMLSSLSPSPTNSTHMTSNYRVESVSNCRPIGRRRREKKKEMVTLINTFAAAAHYLRASIA